MPISKQILVKLGYSKTPHGEYWVFVLNIYQCVLNNLYFPKPPIDMAVFKDTLDRYGKAISAALDGSKKVLALRDSLRHSVNGMFRLLGAYVQDVSDNDPAIFQTSGYEAITSSYVPDQPLDTPQLRKIAHGANPGELLLYLPPSYRKIANFYVRFAEVDAAGITGEWTYTYVSKLKGPALIQGLKPGTRYAFQISALGNLGKTDWSDSVTKICT